MAWEEQNATFLGHFNNNPPHNIVWVCPVSLGEIEWGLRVTVTTNPLRRARCRQFIEDNALDFVHRMETTIRDSYALIMERIWQAHPPPTGRVDTQKHLSERGVDINDVWIAAVALEHGLVLLTEDRMDVIRNCMPEITFENWLV